MIVNYGAYRIVCTTTINRYRDTPNLFDLDIRDCITLVNHDVDYFTVRGLSPASAQACVNQVELSGVENPIGDHNYEATATVSDGTVTLNRNGAVLDACSLSEAEYKSSPRLAVSLTNLDYRTLVCN